MRNAAAFLLGTLTALSAYGQTLPAGTPVLDEAWRRGQLRGEADSNVSLTVRPLALGTATDSFFQRGIGYARTVYNKGNTALRILPFSLSQQVNTHHPYGLNDGVMIPARGYQVLASGGLYFRKGCLHVQLQPELVLAQNAAFQTFATTQSDAVWRAYYGTVLNQVDAPERFGNGGYARVFAGQSSVRLNFGKLSFGLSTENLWWGPGVRQSLLMSNNAPGFPHLTLNTTSPLHSVIGTFEGQLISGLLKPSGIFPPDTNRTYNGDRLYQPKPNEDRYLNAVVVSWQPRWTKGLFVGVSRVFYLYKSDIDPSLNGYLPVIGHLFKNAADRTGSEDARKRDQLISLFFRLLLPKEKAEVYGEFGRNDHSGNLEDFLLEPEHSRAYIMGMRKLFNTNRKGAEIELFAETANLQMPTTLLVRAQESWYAHYQVRAGYTHLGQVIGAGIGPGANSQSVGLAYVKGLNRTGLLLERIVHNNDFYYAAFASEREYMRHWVDVSAGLHRSWQSGHLLYDARLVFTKSLNYEWEKQVNKTNLQAGLSASYLF